MLLVGTNHSYVRLYDASTSQAYTSPHHADHHTAPVNTVAYGPDGRQYASGDRAGCIKVWDGVSSRAVFSFGGAHEGALVSSVAFSRNAHYLLTAGHDNIARLRDLRAGGRVLCKYTGARGDTLGNWRACFSHDEASVLTPDVETGGVAVWDARLTQMVTRLSPPKGQRVGVGCLAHSPNRPVALTCSGTTVALWGPPPRNHQEQEQLDGEEGGEGGEGEGGGGGGGEGE